jgi:hypothetical protein
LLGVRWGGQIKAEPGISGRRAPGVVTAEIADGVRCESGGSGRRKTGLTGGPEQSEGNGRTRRNAGARGDTGVRARCCQRDRGGNE